MPIPDEVLVASGIAAVIILFLIYDKQECTCGHCIECLKRKRRYHERYNRAYCERMSNRRNFNAQALGIEGMNNYIPGLSFNKRTEGMAGRRNFNAQALGIEGMNNYIPGLEFNRDNMTVEGMSDMVNAGVHMHKPIKKFETDLNRSLWVPEAYVGGNSIESDIDFRSLRTDPYAEYKRSKEHITDAIETVLVPKDSPDGRHFMSHSAENLSKTETSGDDMSNGLVYYESKGEITLG